jgi:Tfp pilus assembly ATPase PilU
MTGLQAAAEEIKTLVVSPLELIGTMGEIRDRETAEIAVRTALVGRLLLSTLHANDATGAVPRLLDIGSNPSSSPPR